MADSGWDIEPLTARHDRQRFTCGADSLDHYLRQQASQDQRRRAAAVYVLCPTGSLEVAGYHTLSAAGIVAGELPPDLARRLPRYPVLPATRLGRLAVDVRFRGRGLGGILLADALQRAAAASLQVGSVAVVVDALDDAAVRFYEHFGFLRFPGRDRVLFLPMATIRALGTD